MSQITEEECALVYNDMLTFTNAELIEYCMALMTDDYIKDYANNLRTQLKEVNK